MTPPAPKARPKEQSLSTREVGPEGDCTVQVDVLDLLPRPRGLGVHHQPHDPRQRVRDRKSTRLNSSHVRISYAVFCLKKKNTPKFPTAAATPDKGTSGRSSCATGP